jgi:hypothetical protein
LAASHAGATNHLHAEETALFGPAADIRAFRRLKRKRHDPGLFACTACFGGHDIHKTGEETWKN